MYTLFQVGIGEEFSSEELPEIIFFGLNNRLKLSLNILVN